MRRLLAVAMSGAVMAAGAVSVAEATPAQDKKITALTKQVKKQRAELRSLRTVVAGNYAAMTPEAAFGVLEHVYARLHPLSGGSCGFEGPCTEYKVSRSDSTYSSFTSHNFDFYRTVFS